jgi:hypothetical protein
VEVQGKWLKRIEFFHGVGWINEDNERNGPHGNDGQVLPGRKATWVRALELLRTGNASRQRVREWRMRGGCFGVAERSPKARAGSTICRC